MTPKGDYKHCKIFGECNVDEYYMGLESLLFRVFKGGN